MSDFLSDLEAELVAAARRRSGSRRRIVLPRLRPVAVVAVVALLVAAIAVVRALDGGSRPADERPSVPPGPAIALAVPAAEVARPCPGVKQRTEDREWPQRYPLGIFTRPQTEPDAMPSLNGADSYSWIPAGTIYLGGSRRPGLEDLDEELHLVPIAEPRRGGRCGGEREAALGVCLVVGAGDAVVKCFSDEDVEAGRAFALTGPGVVHGIAPDGAGRVTLQAGGKTVTADVHENAYEIRAPVVAGEYVRLELERVRDCRPSAELLDALPALREGAWQTLPAPAREATPAAGVRQWAQRVEIVGELELWAIARCDGVQHACVLAVHGGSWVTQPCATAPELRGGTASILRVAGDLVIVGMAPPGTHGVQLVSGSRVHDVPLAGGVFGGVVPPGFERPDDVRYLR